MRYTGVFLVMLAALFWGISGAIANVLMNKGWDPFVIAFYRGAIGFLFFFVWVFHRFKQRRVPYRRFFLWSILAGLGVAGNFTFYFLSIEASSISVAVTLMYTAPVFVLLSSLIFGFERSSYFKWLSVFSVVLGIVLLTESYQLDTVHASIFGTFMGLASGVSYAVFIFGFKYAAPHGSPQAILVIAFAVLTTILIWLGDSHQALAVLTTPSWPLFVVLGVLGAGLSFIFYIVGLNHTAPAVASIVAMVEPVTASLFGVVVLHESLATPQIFGMGLILVTVTALSVYSSAQNEPLGSKPLAE